MAKIESFKYKDPNIIYSIFNYSRTAYEKYCELKEGNLLEAQEQLNTAGTKLYQAYELALKCYLDKQYKHLYEEHTMDWKTANQLRKQIEKGRQNNGTMVDVRYLYDQLCKYASPHPSASRINFEVIKNNAKSVNNQNKHFGNNVEEGKYKESFDEIRKVIIVYINPNPPIQIIESPQYASLQEACDYWKNNSRYNYCLISGNNSSEINILRMAKLLYKTEKGTDKFMSSLFDFCAGYGYKPFRIIRTSGIMVLVNTFMFSFIKFVEILSKMWAIPLNGESFCKGATIVWNYFLISIAALAGQNSFELREGLPYWLSVIEYLLGVVLFAMFVNALYARYKE